MCVPNSERPNYDDLNELFWRPECLQWSYHCLDDGPGGFRSALPGVRKAFRERSRVLHPDVRDESLDQKGVPTVYELNAAFEALRKLL